MAVVLSLPSGAQRDGLGLDDNGSGSAWIPLSEGARWLATSSWMLLGAFLPTALFGTLGTCGAILVAAYSACHAYAMTQLRSGLMPLIAERPEVGVRASLAWWSAIAFLVLAAAVGVVGFFVPLPLPFRFLAFAVLTPLLATSLITLRLVGLALADACGLRDDLPQPTLTTILLGGLAPMNALAWIFAAVSFGLPSPVKENLFAVAAWTAVITGGGLVWVLLRQIDLFARIGFAVSASASFSSAARRVARLAKGPVRMPPARNEELPAIEIVEDVPPHDAPSRPSR